MAETQTEKKVCRGETKKGGPCGAYPMANGFCISHQSLERREKLGHGNVNGHQAKKRDPLTAPLMMRRILEANAMAVLYPYLRAMGLKAMRHKPTGEIVIVPTPETRAKLYGISKDGEVKMSQYEDLAAMMAVAEKMMDRVYGRPKQAISLAGEPDSAPVQVSVSGSTERALEVAQILVSTGAVSPASRN